MGRDEIVERGMGGLEAVSQGTDEAPKLILMRHEGRAGAAGPGRQGGDLRLGGISIKPSAAMHEMKMDMSGGPP